jgi:ribosome maturation factor RimP
MLTLFTLFALLWAFFVSMVELNKNIAGIIREIVETNGFFLIDVIFKGSKNSRIIEVYFDGEKNITADDCAKLSRELNSKIEGESLIDSAYRLDISSPGIERPLKYLKQFPKHVNRKFDITYKQKDEIKKFSGKLINVQDNFLTFMPGNNQETIIKFDDIITAKVLASFS